MSSDLQYEQLTTISDLIRRKKLSSVEVTDATLCSASQSSTDNITPTRPCSAERALTRAKAADAEIARGLLARPSPWRAYRCQGPLLHDLRSDFLPAPRFSSASFHPSTLHVVERLEDAGAILLLESQQMTEGAYTSHHPHVAAPLEPVEHELLGGLLFDRIWLRQVTSLGLCYGSLGSDTGGSIRFPSATCGLAHGHQADVGRVSRYGVFPLAETLDHVGPMTRSVADAAAMLGIIAGADRNDPDNLQGARPGLS